MNLLVPQHGEVRFGHFETCRQVQPDLKQLTRVGLVLVAQRKHLAMHDAFAGRQPLHITGAKARCRAQRIRVVNMPLPHDGHRLKASVRVRRKAGDGLPVVHAPAVFVKSSPLTNKISLAHIATAFLVIVLGTIVTGSGPHAGDAQAERLDFDIQTVSWIHADAVILLLGITFGFYVAQGTSTQTKKAIKIFAAIALAQGGIGYIQYFTGVPEILVAAHILGATLVWIAAWRIRLSVITQNG